ncbi:MAG: hypothetical protein JWM86_300 [Thermoleophilia bacterium]|nr:hypothetical protein [Thermoleophilia bacterium]
MRRLSAVAGAVVTGAFSLLATVAGAVRRGRGGDPDAADDEATPGR